MTREQGAASSVASSGRQTTSGVFVTGEAQRTAWRDGVLPPVEQLPHGIWSLPVPMAEHPLRYTLCYVIEDPRGPVLIDPGWPDDDAWSHLEDGLEQAGFTTSDVQAVLVSHVHSDHHGLAGRVREASGCWIGMHPREADALRRLADGSELRQRNMSFTELAGVPPSERGELRSDGERFRALAETLPDRELDEHTGRLVPGRSLRALWTPGHTPGHLSFVDDDAEIAFTGDHLLPRITPNVSSYGLGDGTDALGDYLGSLQALSSVAADFEVLPGHEYRFRGTSARVEQLLRHHDARTEEIVAVVAEAGNATVWEVATQVTWSRGWAETTGQRRRLALAETLAHLRHLDGVGRLLRAPGPPLRWALPGPGAGFLGPSARSH